MTDSKKGVTRRRFLERVGMAGGSVALYETMTALGLINLPEVWAGPPQLPAGSGTGKKVVILGAGIGGLTAAYELTKANYQCQIIELTERAGGRNHSARRGTVLEETTKSGETFRQVVSVRFIDPTGEFHMRTPAEMDVHYRHCGTLTKNYAISATFFGSPGNSDEIERKLAASPSISVPTITIEGDANGAPHPAPESYAGRFTGPYEHRTISGGVRGSDGRAANVFIGLDVHDSAGRHIQLNGCRG